MSRAPEDASRLLLCQGKSEVVEVAAEQRHLSSPCDGDCLTSCMGAEP